jgi:hypothetical protein
MRRYYEGAGYLQRECARGGGVELQRFEKLLA